MKELRQNLGITYGIGAGIVSNNHRNIIFGSTGNDSSSADIAISAAKDTLSRVKREGIDEQLFNNAKVSIINSYIFSAFNSNNIAAKWIIFM